MVHTKTVLQKIVLECNVKAVTTDLTLKCQNLSDKQIEVLGTYPILWLRKKCEDERNNSSQDYIKKRRSIKFMTKLI